MTLVRLADCPATPWKNGGGTTRQLAAWPPGAGLDDFVWRLSLAEVAQDGPFSAFAGIDRTLTLIAGDGMVLTVDGADSTLTADGAPLRFAGEAATTARLTGGPILDLNVMTRRDSASHRVAIVTPDDPIPSAAVALVCRVPGTVVDGQTLSPGDAIMAAPSAPLGATRRSAPMIAVSLDMRATAQGASR